MQSRKINDELYFYYVNNCKNIDQAFQEFCLYEGRFEFQDQRKALANDVLFWEFVENFKEKNG